MTPDAKELANAIKRARHKCDNLVLTIFDAYDIAEFGQGRMRQENPNCTNADIESMMAFMLKASNAVEMAGIMLDLAKQKLQEKMDAEG